MLIAVSASCSRPAERVDSSARRVPAEATTPVERIAPSSGKQGPANGKPARVQLEVAGGGADSRASWVVAGLARGSRSDTVVVYPLQVSSGRVVVAGTFEATRRPGEREAPLAQALSCRGDTVLVSRGTLVERRRPFVRGSAVQSARLPESPTALLSQGNHAIAGGLGRVYDVDFSRSPSPVVSLHDDESLRKPVDFILELGATRTIAVDDVVLPKAAFVFNRFPDDRLQFQFRGDLPSGPNEGYVSAASSGSKLAIASRFSIRSGYGHRLHVCTVEHETVRCETVSEMVTLRTQETTLLTGERFTQWRGIALVSDRVFVAAGGRGILAIDRREALRVGPAGRCLDVVGAGGHLVALMSFGTAREDSETGLHGTDETQIVDRPFLVVADWDSSTGRLVERWRSPVPKGIERLQR